MTPKIFLHLIDVRIEHVSRDSEEDEYLFFSGIVKEWRS
jgi:hypothetical protein